MPRDAVTLADVREPTLTTGCEGCGRYGQKARKSSSRLLFRSQKARARAARWRPFERRRLREARAWRDAA
jgi:hypothetical protein